MKKILGLLMGAACWINVLAACATEKFEILPDLPEPLSAARASSVSTTNDVVTNNLTQNVGQEPNIISVVFSLLFVVLLIYATGIIYARLNKVGFKTLKKMNCNDDSKVSVISTTPLGNNKTLHVVELDGKRMLIGASTNSIDLIKDLGSFPPQEIEEGEYSKIEIPNIRIPKIEIPKIEFPNIGFTKTTKKTKPEITEEENNNKDKPKNFNNEKEYDDDFVISDIYEENSDGIIDKLFVPNKEQKDNNTATQQKNAQTQKIPHSVDPDEYALYKKYL